MSARTIPVEGVHPDIPAHVYHGWDCASNSRLSIIHEKSPAHLRAQMEAPSEPTDAQVIGTATHVAVLEPDSFDGLYARGPEAKRNTNAGKAEWAAVEAKHPEKMILKPDDFDLCLALRDAVHRHAIARALIEEAADRELSVVWGDPETGVLCKARLDGLARSIGAIVDLKTTKDAAPREYMKSVHNFGYHRQAAFYLDAARVHGMELTDFVQVVVEKSAPYGVAVYRIEEAAIEAGRRQLRRLLDIYAECLSSGQWPCYGDEIQSITLPAWAWGQIEAEVL